VPQPGASAGMADRPSERQRTGITGPDPSPRTSIASGDVGCEGSGPAPSSLGTRPGQEPGCGEVEPPIPRFRHGGKVLSKRRAAVGDDRAGRSSCPARSGQRPPGASLDALLLLPSPRADVRCEDRGVSCPTSVRASSYVQSAFEQAPAPHDSGPLVPPGVVGVRGEVGDTRGEGGRGVALTASGNGGGRCRRASRYSAGRR